jgi:hypothetical protein
MKVLTTITLQGSHKTAQGGYDPIASRSAAEGHPRQSIPFGTHRRYSDSLLQGWVSVATEFEVQSPPSIHA